MKAKKFRVAVSGTTVDSRTIEPSMLQEAVANFNTDTYGIRANVEHIRGASGDKPFGAVGDVVGLSVQEDTLILNGKSEKRTCLYAEVLPNARGIELNKNDQKVYTSIELSPDFAGTGKFGLIGLAFTDSPASIGTERLQFSKVHKTLIFTCEDPIEVKFDEDTPTESQNAFTAAISALSSAVSALTGGAKPEPKTPPQNPAAPAGMEQFTAVFAAQTEAITALGKTLTESVTTLTAGLEKQKRDFDALKADLERTQANNHSARPPVSGGGGNSAEHEADF